VFVVHGHDVESLNQLELTLRRIGADPVILAQQPVVGAATIVEQLETQLPTADAVVCLLTPDDEGRRRGVAGKLVARARENVLIEAGYAVLSRRARSLLIALGDVSIPSDFDGILRVQDSGWTKDTAVAVARSLHEMGLSIEPIEATRDSRRRSVVPPPLPPPPPRIRR
jgi:predicted nucleotide-binding protein